MELDQNEQKTIRFSQNNEYIKDGKNNNAAFVRINRKKEKIQLKEQSNINKPKNAKKEEQRQYMPKSELVDILMKKINENYEFCYKLLRQSQWNIDDAIMQSSLIIYSQSQSLDENLLGLSPLNKQLSQQLRDKDIRNKNSKNEDAIQIKEKNQDKIQNSLEKLQEEGQNILDLGDKNDENQNKQEKQGVDDKDIKKFIQENDKIIQNSDFNEKMNIEYNINMSERHRKEDNLIQLKSEQEKSEEKQEEQQQQQVIQYGIAQNKQPLFQNSVVNNEEDKDNNNNNDINSASQVLCELTYDVKDIIGLKQRISEIKMKQYIKDFLQKNGCVKNNEKIVIIDKQQLPELYEIFKNKHMSTQISTKKFYRKFKKQFIKESKYEYQPEFNQEIENNMIGLFETIQAKKLSQLPNNYNIQEDSQYLKNEQLLMTLVKCQQYVAREALKIFSNDLKTAENFLKQAIEFCRGDEEQAIRLISVDILELGALNSLTDCQRQALNHIARLAQQASQGVIPKLRKRFKKLNFTDLDLDQTLKYIRDEAPIIIHVNLQKVLKFFTEDTHYRNQFETNISGGVLNQNTRKDWEDRLFGNHYNMAKPFERPKYGVLNILKSQEGVASCRQYGRSFLVLKEVRLRTTFVGQDSGQLAQKKRSIENSIATCQHYAHVLNTFKDQELINVVEVAIGKFPQGQSGQYFKQYKEIQIHGEVKFDKHVQYLYYEPQELMPPHKKVKKQKIKKVEIVEKEDKSFQADSLKEQLELFRILYPNIEIIEIQKG